MSDPQVTVLYYTSNREEEPFASRIRDNILKYKGDLPLISVSQKPLDFGENICVGEHESCYHNEFRQIQIGLKAVKTPFVLHAEADFLYPPEYFKFVPPEPRNYRYDNVWINYARPGSSPRFHFKKCSVGAEINHTQTWLERLDYYLKDRPEWMKASDPPLSASTVFRDDDNYMWTGPPAISFKTVNALGRYTNLYNGHNNKNEYIRAKHELPFWGSAEKIRKEMFE